MNNLISLLQLSDPTLPIGGFSHSAGLETYVQCGMVKDKETAKEFIVNQLCYHIQHTDAALVSLAYDVSEKKDLQLLINLDQECTAVKMSREIREASQKLGWRLIRIFSSLTQIEFANEYKAAIENGDGLGNYPIVFGLYCNLFQISKKEALTGFYYNCAAGMITNCVKLIPLGQQDGQQVLFSLHDLINELAEASLAVDKDSLGLCCTGFDIRCMQHEQLYSRLYMS